MAKKEIVLKTDTPSPSNGKRLSQMDVPGVSLSQALRVPKAIIDNYGSDSVKPLDIASALNMTPNSGPFRQLCGAAIAYGLTAGGCKAENVETTPLARRILAPEEEGDDRKAKREAVLKPRIMKEFLEKYNGNSLPQRHDIALNVLTAMGVPKDRAESAYAMILDNANDVGFIRDIKGKQYVDIKWNNGLTTNETDPNADEDTDHPDSDAPPAHVGGDVKATPEDSKQRSALRKNNRVFISHGKDRSITGQIKEILTFGKFEAVVSVEKESTAIPVPEKVFEDMRSCAAAVIHVASEGEFLAPNGTKGHRLNENVLIEIGAAIALCRKNVVLLVEKSTPLPSNLQGLYRCEYEGDKLDYEATMKLLKTFNHFELA